MWFPKKCHCSLGLILKKCKILHFLITTVHKISDYCVQRCGLNSVYELKRHILVPSNFKMFPLIILFLNVCKKQLCMVENVKLLETFNNQNSLRNVQ